MCIKCPYSNSRRDIFIIVSDSRPGKTMRIAQSIVNCDDIPDTYEIPEYLQQWAQYFFKNIPITKADLREVMEFINR
jgi:uncharacterized protein YqkB